MDFEGSTLRHACHRPSVWSGYGVYRGCNPVRRTRLVYLDGGPIIGFRRAQVGSINPVSKEPLEPASDPRSSSASHEVAEEK